MAQVKQTVDNALDAGMYAMINIHWDGGWLENNIGATVDPVINAKQHAYATQIATAFAGYDNRLLFAAANEPNVHNPDEMKTLMYYYQTFVNAVRATGSNNTNRWLVMQSGGDTLWLNALPTDTVTNRIMVEYHNYTPSLFTIIHDDQVWGNAIYFWGPAYHSPTNLTRNATWGAGRRHRRGLPNLGRLVCQQRHSGLDRRNGGVHDTVSDRNGSDLESCFHALLGQVCLGIRPRPRPKSLLLEYAWQPIRLDFRRSQ